MYPNLPPVHCYKDYQVLIPLNQKLPSESFFLGRLITEPKMAQSVRSLFMSRAESYFDASIASVGVLPSIIETLN